MLFELLYKDPVLFVLVTLSLIICLSVHEFAHAFVADKLGDPTPRFLGRLTINPVAHIDPMGMLLLIFAGFGWGKPVSFDPSYLKDPKRDTALIAFAGPLSNILLAIVLAIIFRVFGPILPLSIGTFLYVTIYYNLVLAFFNLIPIHPLDGYKVVFAFLKGDLYYQWLEVEKYGIVILLVLVLTGTTGHILNPAIQFSLSLLGF